MISLGKLFSLFAFVIDKIPASDQDYYPQSAKGHFHHLLTGCASWGYQIMQDHGFWPGNVWYLFFVIGVDVVVCGVLLKK